MKKIDSPKEVVRAGFLDKYNPFKYLLFSLIITIFIIYPNIAIISWERSYLGEAKYTAYL